MKPWMKNVLLLLCSTVVAFLLCEAALRLAGVSHPKFYKPDYYTAAALRPGVEGWYHGENDVYVRINSRGLRDREHTLEKPEGTFRTLELMI